MQDNSHAWLLRWKQVFCTLVSVVERFFWSSVFFTPSLSISNH
jgi:hypothetical protein